VTGQPASSNSNQTRASLANDIWRACDILRRDNNCGGVMEYVEHLAWLLFLRFLDAQEEVWETEAALDSRPYQRILDGDLRWSSWARKDWDADELLRFVHGTLIPTLQSLSGDPLRETIQGVFTERNVVVAASGYNLKEVIAIVDGIDFHSEDDIFTVSHVYEDLLQRLGNENRLAGEFYTPRPVIRFVVGIVAPLIDETVYDPACGSCGFLAQAYERMRGQAQRVEEWRTLQEHTFYGQEKKAVPALLGTLNMVLHGVTAPKIRRVNTLEESVLGAVSDRYDVVLTNPPFGGTEGRHIQANFPVRSNATELLFVQHIMKKLKARDSARCGMVVPEGTLFRGGAFAEVKKQLLEQFDLHTVVSLPPGTFAPYSDVKTALIFFERPGPTEAVWYYEMALPEGLKKFSKSSPIQDEHFCEAQELWAAWDTYRRSEGPRPEPTGNSWIMPADEIRERDYDLSARNPNQEEAERFRHPAEITAGLLERLREMTAIVEDLHEMVGDGEE
jgi:type I restriction enzyme M protein